MKDTLMLLFSHPRRSIVRFALIDLAFVGFVVGYAVAWAGERTESFDREPDWEAHNNTLGQKQGRAVRQDFGYAKTTHVNDTRGEIGGWVTPAAEPAYYAAALDSTGFAKPLSASGTLYYESGGGHVLIGFFNKDTINEWRTPNTIVLRLSGRGDTFYAYVEYCTCRWRAGGDDPQGFSTLNSKTGRQELLELPAKRHLKWTLNYDPQGNGGQGTITATIDKHQAICHLAPGHKQDGATFNRCGILNVMKSIDGGGELWLDDLNIQGRALDLATDPGWEALGNRREYQTHIVRPLFDFGFRESQYAGGGRRGELGGLLFRGDCRYEDKLAWYADRVGPLTLSKPLRISGKVALRRGVSDSGVLLGFFNSRESTMQNPAQDTGLPRSFVGISTDAPSREGFYLAPTYRLHNDVRLSLGEATVPHLYPDGKSHDFSFVYDPAAAKGRGVITVTLDGESLTHTLPTGAAAAGTTFDRFGLLTPWVDGNSQLIFFDDLTYTTSQE